MIPVWVSFLQLKTAAHWLQNLAETTLWFHIVGTKSSSNVLWSLWLKNSSQSCALPWAYCHMPLENVTSKSHNNSLVSGLHFIVLFTNSGDSASYCAFTCQVQNIRPSYSTGLTSCSYNIAEYILLYCVKQDCHLGLGVTLLLFETWPGFN